MEITQQADYAVRAVLDLALQTPGERVTSGDVAARQSIPLPFLSKILARLAAEGLVNTQRGVYGGIRLGKPATEISLLEVVEAIDGPITVSRCTYAPGDCPQLSSCTVQPVWVDLRTEIRDRLQKVNFAQLASKQRHLIPVSDKATGVMAYAPGD